MSDISRSYLAGLSQAELFHEISSICAIVNSVVSHNELLARSLERVLKVFNARRGSIFIYNEAANELELRVAVGLNVDEKQAMIKRLGEGVVGQVAQRREPVIVKDIHSDDRFFGHKPKSSYQTASFICAPLLLKDQLIGVINITDKNTGQKFQENELQLLDFIASQIALNHRRITLYRKFQNVLKETQTLKDKLGESDEQTKQLKRQIVIQDKLATIGKLAGGIAHEFNNPLDGVMRYTNLSLEQVQDNEVVRGYLLEIKQGLNRMAIIVRNLLRCSREDKLTEDNVDFKKALDRAVYNLQAELSHKNIQVERDIPDGLPEFLDLGIERVLVNLIRNAIDAIDDEGTISISADYAHDVFRFTVKDTGKGMDLAQAEDIFEPFYTTKDIDKGCGLGLTIVGEIIKSYNGKIDVDSELGQGAMFTVRLPIESDDDE